MNSQPGQTANQERENWICYILVSQRVNSQTYTGKTNAFERRLRQHNGELSGDCRSTKRYRPWRVLRTITGFSTNREAMQFEWALKHQRAPRSSGVTNRVQTLLKVLQQPRSTNKAPLYTEMQPLSITVHAPRDVFLGHAGLNKLPTIAHARFIFQDQCKVDVAK